MRNLLKKLLTSAHDPARFQELLNRKARKLTPELAAEAEQIYEQAFETRQMPLAQVASLVATHVYISLGLNRKAIICFLNFTRILFVEADTVKQYQTTQAYAAEIIAMAIGIQASDLAFQGTLLSANCFYFASEIAESPNPKENLLVKALDDIVNASKWREGINNDEWLQQFVSLLCAVIAAIHSSTLEDESKVQSSLRELAAATEELIPIEFESIKSLKDAFGDANLLAYLSYHYGKAAVASARLDVTIDREEQSGDIDSWLETVFLYYQGSRDCAASAKELADLRRALRNRMEEYRLHFRSRVGRLWGAQKLDFIFGELLRDELREGALSFSEIFRAVDATKARMLLDQMCVRIQDFSTEETVEEAARLEKKVLNLMQEAETKLEQLSKWELSFLDFELKETAEDTDELRKLRLSEKRLVSQLSIGNSAGIFPHSSELHEAYKLHQKILTLFEDLYSTNNAGFRGTATIADPSNVINALQSDEALIEFCIPYHWVHTSYELVILVLTAKKSVVIHVPLDKIPGWKNSFSFTVPGHQTIRYSLLGNMVQQLRVAIRRGNDIEAQRHLEALYQILILPLLENGLQPHEFRRWIFIPHSMLHYIPFAALSSGQGHHLIDDVALTIAPSGSVWFELQRQKRQPVTSFLGFANPDLPYTHLPSLPDAEKELARICKSLESLKCSAYKNKEATEEVLMSQAVGKSILHIATHGDFPEQDVIDFHRILLAPTVAYDGRVNAEEVRRMNLHAARLVVLSICDGGLYRIGPGDEPYGLIAALLTAGAENIIGTLWPLDDRMGRLFMIEFYKHLLQKGPAGALRQTYKQFIQDSALLRDWAGLVMVGTGRPWN